MDTNSLTMVHVIGLGFSYYPARPTTSLLQTTPTATYIPSERTMSSMLSECVYFSQALISSHTLIELIYSRLGSEILELVTDGGRKSSFVHKNLVTAQSALLRTKLNGAAAEQKLDLQSWDAKTVGHFVNFLYLHTYGTVKPEPLSPGTDLSDGTASEATNTESRVHTPDTVRSDETIQPDASLDRPIPRPLTPVHALWDSTDDANDESEYCSSTARKEESLYCVNYPHETHSYRNTFLAHARLYSLAQSLDMDVLCRMAYNRLLHILGNIEPFTPGSPVVIDILELLSYVSNNTEGKDDGMRNLVTQFAALNFPALQGTEMMNDLVRWDSQFAVDMMEKVRRRLVASEDERDRYRGISTSLEHVTEKLRAEQENCTALKGRNASLENDLEDMRLAKRNQEQVTSDMTGRATAVDEDKDGAKAIAALILRRRKA